MNLSWQVFILLHALFSALQALQFRAIARNKKARHAALAVNALAFSSLYVCGLLILPIIGGVNTQDFLNNWLIYLTTSCLFVIALYLMYKAFTHLDSATVSVLGTSSALFTVIIAGIFLGERLSNMQFLGIAILLPCIWYVLLLAREHHKLLNFKDLNWLHGFWFVLGSSLCLAVAHVLEKEILIRSSIGTYVTFGWLLQALVAWGLYLLAGRHANNILRQPWMVRSSLQLGVMRAATGLFFIIALSKSNNVSLVTTVANFRVIIVAVLAGWLLGERNFYYKKLAAAAVSVIALSIIFWN
ncbi:MAG: DMT family transporter [bacterium]|nr:DMT family transporter [bacterium]